MKLGALRNLYEAARKKVLDVEADILVLLENGEWENISAECLHDVLMKKSAALSKQMKIQNVLTRSELATKVQSHPSLSLYQARLELQKLEQMVAAYSHAISSLYARFASMPEDKIDLRDIEFLNEKKEAVRDRLTTLKSLVDDAEWQTVVVTEFDEDLDDSDEDTEGNKGLMLLKSLFSGFHKKQEDAPVLRVDVSDEDSTPDEDEISPKMQRDNPNLPVDIAHWEHAAKLISAYQQNNSSHFHAYALMEELGGNWSTQEVSSFIDSRTRPADSYYDPHARR